MQEGVRNPSRFKFINWYFFMSNIFFLFFFLPFHSLMQGAGGLRVSCLAHLVGWVSGKKKTQLPVGNVNSVLFHLTCEQHTKTFPIEAHVYVNLRALASCLREHVLRLLSTLVQER